MTVPVLAKTSRGTDPVIVTTDDPGTGHDERGIRCPLCHWQPSAASRWHCVCHGTPEPFFEACGTVWNTFDTRGRCPGCQHQWQWTTCLSCGVASRHEDWYYRNERPS